MSMAVAMSTLPRPFQMFHCMLVQKRTDNKQLYMPVLDSTSLYICELMYECIYMWASIL